MIEISNCLFSMNLVLYLKLESLEVYDFNVIIYGYILLLIVFIVIVVNILMIVVFVRGNFCFVIYVVLIGLVVVNIL